MTERAATSLPSDQGDDEPDPQAAVERRVAARHLLANPLCCAEHDADVFALIRRHSNVLDKWFTQRLGYRLHVDADTARLFKAGTTPARPLRTRNDRAFQSLEYVMLCLALGATVAGPAVTSLRDLVGDIRSAATDAGIELSNDASERRALVSALKWMIDHGLAVELHEHVDGFLTDEGADAILRLRPDRVAMMPSGALLGAPDVATVMERAERRDPARTWMRARLTEDPVLYRDDLSDAEWGELRRRLGAEEQMLESMFGLSLESRAEGVAAIDPDGTLSDVRFPSTGTVGHAALRFIESVLDESSGPVTLIRAHTIVFELVVEHERHWSGEMVGNPAALLRAIVELLQELRLASVCGDDVVLLPAAGRYRALERRADDPAEVAQDALW